jgi:hypothetical protein
LQEQVSTAVHVPFPLQTDGELALIPKHNGNSQFVPVYPEGQVQVFGEPHVPRPEQTVALVAKILLHFGVEQSFPPQFAGTLHEQTSVDVQTPLPPQTVGESLSIPKQEKDAV